MTTNIIEIRDTCRRLDLTGWQILFELPLEKIEASYNGIGCESMPDIVRWTLTELNGVLVPCALIHDVQWDYVCNGGDNDFYKSNADFEHNGIICADSAFAIYNPARYYFRLKATEYRRLLDRFGRSAYLAAIKAR